MMILFCLLHYQYIIWCLISLTLPHCLLIAAVSQKVLPWLHEDIQKNAVRFFITIPFEWRTTSLYSFSLRRLGYSRPADPFKRSVVFFHVRRWSDDYLLLYSCGEIFLFVQKWSFIISFTENALNCLELYICLWLQHIHSVKSSLMMCNTSCRI